MLIPCKVKYYLICKTSSWHNIWPQFEKEMASEFGYVYVLLV